MKSKTTKKRKVTKKAKPLNEVELCFILANQNLPAEELAVKLSRKKDLKLVGAELERLKQVNLEHEQAKKALTESAIAPMVAIRDDKGQATALVYSGQQSMRDDLKAGQNEMTYSEMSKHAPGKTKNGVIEKINPSKP